MTTTQSTEAHTPGTVVKALVGHAITAAIAKARSEAWMDKGGAATLIRVLRASAAYGIDNRVIVHLPNTVAGRLHGHRALDLLNEAIRLVDGTEYAVPAGAVAVQNSTTEATLTW